MTLQQLVAYIRTSSDDLQSPEDSLRWQLSLAEGLVAGRAEIVAVIHDHDVSRAIPWDRRPEASILLAEMATPDRGWDGIVIGEPQRAFGTAVQYQIVAAAMEYHSVSLWVPEVGGQVDFQSEAHDIILNIFGTMSKAERNRLKKRVRAAMMAMASTDRFLGGRPNFGYMLVPTGVLHPNPEKARYGIELQRLDLHPVYAPVVVQIFAWRVEHVGYRAIATRLDEAGVPSPSAADPGRNPHRRQSGWSISALQAICANARYMGTDTWGRLHKVEVLIDPMNPAAGHETKRRPQQADKVVSVEEGVPAIVTPDVWAAAQEAKKTNTSHRTATKPVNRPYLLRSLLHCGHCHGLLGGETRKSRAGSETTRYVCRLRDKYPTVANHPTKVTIAESAIKPLVDEWVSEELSPARLDLRAEELASTDTTRQHIQLKLNTLLGQKKDLEAKEARFKALMEDPNYSLEEASSKLGTTRSELDRVKSEIAGLRRSTRPSWTAADYRKALRDGLGDIPGLLAVATTEERNALYKLVGLELTYTRTGDGCGQLSGVLRPHLEARGAVLRVGGGTPRLATRLPRVADVLTLLRAA